MRKEKSLDPYIMNQFTGSEHWYRFGIVPNITCTDGAKYVADTAGAYWLLDEIAIAQRFEGKVAAEQFQVWKLTVYDNDGATLVARTAMTPSSSPSRLSSPIFLPKHGVTLWFANNVIYLPSEH
jgi:hypothetical protein